MAEITIADATPRVQYTVGGSSTTGPWTIPWPYYETGDIKVYFDSTLKTISTHYTISGTAVDDGFSGGTVSAGVAQSNITVTIVRDIPVARTTDFPVGPFNVKTLNKDLDKLYAIGQQAEENFSRKVGRSATDTATYSLDLPVGTSTAKTLMLSSSSGMTLGATTAEIEAAATQGTAAATSATAAASSATAAASSSSSASTSATASASSATSAAATAATLTGASSTTSLAIGTGSKAFTVAAGLGFVAGDWVIATSNANPTVNYMNGPIASYSSTTMTVTVDNIGGSGTLNDWTIRRSGTQGATGATGATGSTGATGATGSASSDPELSAIAGLTSAAGKMIEFTGSGSAQVIDVTTAGKALMDDANASAQRTTMGVAIGSDVAAYNADTLFADVADNLTKGYSTTVYDAGTKSSGTYTPDQDNGNIQQAINGGAHTLAPTVDNCAVIIQYTNNASAGTITTSGFTLVDGDDISTTNGDDFFFYLTKANGFSLLTVKALQ